MLLQGYGASGGKEARIAAKGFHGMMVIFSVFGFQNLVSGVNVPFSLTLTILVTKDAL